MNITINIDIAKKNFKHTLQNNLDKVEKFNNFSNTKLSCYAWTKCKISNNQHDIIKNDIYSQLKLSGFVVKLDDVVLVRTDVLYTGLSNNEGEYPGKTDAT